MKVIMNTNDYIEVELTDHGIMLYNDNYRHLNHSQSNPLKIQMWEFMNIFGDEFYNGAQQIVKDNKIVFCSASVQMDV